MSFLPDICEINPTPFLVQKNIIIIDNFYNENECKKIIEKLDKLKYSSYSNMKKRGISDQKKLADLLSSISSNYLEYSIQDVWRLSDVNSNFRWLIGDKEYYMSQHLDENILQSINKKSFYTILIYLNNDDDGGDLIFPTINLKVEQKAGRLIIFNQNLPHYSLPCSTSKYFLHSEVFYQRIEEVKDEKSQEAFNLYLQSKNTSDMEEKMNLIDKACETSKIFEDMYYN